MPTQEPPLFRVLFYQENTRYDIYARRIVINEAMPGFVGVADVVFDQHSGAIIDAAEEKVKTEFADVRLFYLNYRDIIRIDEVKKEGSIKVAERTDNRSNILRPAAFGDILTPQFSEDD